MNYIAIVFLFTTLFICAACNKSTDNANSTYKLSYGDSILYLKTQSSDYIVHPTSYRAGRYSGFPDEIEIDETTGAINVSKSETGLRYRITHESPNGDITTTMIVISGITYFDRYYNLSNGDSIVSPVYNADINRPVPLKGSIFDSGNTANSGGCSVKTTDGKINLAESMRLGIFGNSPSNDDKKEFDIEYKLNDNSGKATNKIRVKLYFYNTMADVAPDLLETLQERTDQGVFLQANNNNPFGNFNGNARPGTPNLTAGVAKPRPPCIIIIGQ